MLAARLQRGAAPARAPMPTAPRCPVPLRRPSPLHLARRPQPARAATAARPDSPPAQPQQSPSPTLSSLASSAASLDGFDADDTCPVFIDRDGEVLEVACCDFGFRSGKGRLYSDDYGTIPKGFIPLAIENFQYEYAALRRSFREDEYARIAAQNPPAGPLGWVAYKAGEAVVRSFASIDRWLEDRRIFGKILPVPVPQEVFDPKTGGLSKQCRELRGKLAQLKLSNEAIWERERARERAGGAVEAPPLIKLVYYALCVFIDVAFNNRPIQRFWFLETVARMPYFSYITMLHLLETLGFWRAGVELRQVHMAQELNEMHHNQLMEALGGDTLWADRFLAQHAAVVYYAVLLAYFFISPQGAYKFSELIEAHAVDSYMELLDANEELLKSMPAPYVIARYYRAADLSAFDDFQTRRGVEFAAAAATGALTGASDDDGSGYESDVDLAAGVPMRKGPQDDPNVAPRLPPRRPQIRNLYDAFLAVAEDEGEHVATMSACIDGSVAYQLLAKEEEKEKVQLALLRRQRELEDEGQGGRAAAAAAADAAETAGLRRRGGA
jgi:ubiquinol oxidase